MAPLLSRATVAALLLATLPGQASAAVLDDVAGTALRGVHPDKKASFLGVETFQCDGGKRHPITAFNDDFCDCSDGTDEPGTSACPNSHFFCRNRGHMPTTLFSSRVNDGICDCCDGSDEYNGVKLCPNTCVEAGSAARKELKAKADSYQQGVVELEKMLAKAEQKRAQWASEKESLVPQIAAQEAVVADLRAKKEAAEEEQKRIDEEQRKAQEEADAAKAAAGGDAAAGGGEAADIAAAAAQAAAGDGGAEQPAGGEEAPPPPATGEEAPREETPEERGRRIARQWTNDALAAGEAPPPPDTAAEGGNGEGSGAGSADGSAAEADYGAPLEKPADWDDEEDGPWEAPENPNKKTRREPQSLVNSVRGLWRRAVKAVRGATGLGGRGGGGGAKKWGGGKPGPALERAQAALSSAESALQTLKSQAERVDRLLSSDGGPAGAYLAIADECFQARVDQYTYEMCIFGGAKQDPGGTSLGSWAGFGGADKSVIQFTGGTHCWNGPQRSLTVQAVCGAATSLAEVSEPSRCEYAAKFTTPAACNRALLDDALAALAQAEAEAASVHDELR